MAAKTQYLIMCWQNFSQSLHASEVWKCMPVRTKYIYKLTKFISKTKPLRGNKCISTCIDQNPTIPAFHVMNKPSENTKFISTFADLPHPKSQRGYKMYHNMCWPYPSLSSEDEKMHLHMCWSNPLPFQPRHKRPNPSHAISKCVKQAHPMVTRTQNASLLVFTKFPSMPVRIQKLSVHVKTKFISTCMDQTHPVPAITQKFSQYV